MVMPGSCPHRGSNPSICFIRFFSRLASYFFRVRGGEIYKNGGSQTPGLTVVLHHNRTPRGGLSRRLPRSICARLGSGPGVRMMELAY